MNKTLMSAQTKKGRFRVELQKEDTSKNAVQKKIFAVRFYSGKRCDSAIVGYSNLKDAKKFFLKSVANSNMEIVQ